MMVALLTGLGFAEKNHPLIAEMMASYKDAPFIVDESLTLQYVLRNTHVLKQKGESLQ